MQKIYLKKKTLLLHKSQPTKAVVSRQIKHQDQYIIKIQNNPKCSNMSTKAFKTLKHLQKSYHISSKTNSKM